MPWIFDYSGSFPGFVLQSPAGHCAPRQRWRGFFFQPGEKLMIPVIAAHWLILYLNLPDLQASSTKNWAKMHWVILHLLTPMAWENGAF